MYVLRKFNKISHTAFCLTQNSFDVISGGGSSDTAVGVRRLENRGTEGHITASGNNLLFSQKSRPDAKATGVRR